MPSVILIANAFSTKVVINLIKATISSIIDAINAVVGIIANSVPYYGYKAAYFLSKN